jgi:cytochrome bd ubiquinol oxidase subunit I
LPLMFLHTLASGLATASFFLIAISAYHIWRKKEEEIFQHSFRMAAVVGLVMLVSLGGIGHAQALKIMDVNPMKMVASEAWWDTDDYASMSIFSIPDRENNENRVDIRIPAGFSLLVGFDPTTEVKGINQLQDEYSAKYGPGNYIPPIMPLNLSFRAMVGLDMVMILITLAAVYQFVRKKPVSKIPFFKYFPFVVVMPYIANTAGWLLTEMGRQPWIVFGLMKTSDAVSPNVAPGMVLASLIGFVLVYGLLMAADIYLLVKYAKAGPVEEISPSIQQTAVN